MRLFGVCPGFRMVDPSNAYFFAINNIALINTVGTHLFIQHILNSRSSRFLYDVIISIQVKYHIKTSSTIRHQFMQWAELATQCLHESLFQIVKFVFILMLLASSGEFVCFSVSVHYCGRVLRININGILVKVNESQISISCVASRNACYWITTVLNS